MSDVVNISESFEQIEDLFSPTIVGELNGQDIKLARLEGDKVPWHTHDQEDELFWVLAGELEVLTREASVVLRPGEFTIVNRGVEHRVVPLGQVELVLFEPQGIAHTGSVKSEITRDKYERLDR